MRKILLSICCLVISLTTLGQKVYFIYLQTDPSQPFYVKFGDRIHSSTASGYLILSKLKDTTCNFTVGFPGNKWPESFFSVMINRKDHGFLLKNFGEKGWGLFDLQSLAVQMPVAGSSKKEPPISSDTKDVTAFTEVLSKAADDPALKEKPHIQTKEGENKSEPVIAVPEKQDESKTPKPEIIPEKKTEQPPLSKKDEREQSAKDTVEKKQNTEIVVQPVAKKEEPVGEERQESQLTPQENKVESISYRPSIVRRRSESSTTEGFGLVFTDESDEGNTDTIKLLIPNQKIMLVAPKEEPKEEKKFLELTDNDTITRANEPTTTVVIHDKKGSINKNDCLGIASEEDFFKVRKKMVTQDDEDNMIDEAKKYFKTKCFDTKQIKNLGTLFLAEEFRYKFFDMAYAYVSDIENFASLESELKDKYFISRFKAMLR